MRTLVICGPAILTLLLAAPAAAQKTVRVVADDAALRLQPDMASPVLLVVAAGTVLEIERREADWYGVLLPADAQGLRRHGYIPASLVENLPTSGSELLVVPALRSNYGFGVALGHHFTASAIEISYTRSVHTSTAAFDVGRPGRPSILLYDDESVYNRIGFGFQRYLARRWRAQPYLQVGFGFPWLKVRQGGVVESSVVDATYSGIGADSGAGVLFFLHPRFAVHGAAIYRYDLYLSARGGGGDWGEIRDIIGVHGLDVATGLSFLF